MRIYIYKKNIIFYMFRGKNIIITGGGSGLGRAIAQGFAQQNGNVIICGRNMDKLKNTAANMKNISCYELDVKDVGNVRNFYGELKSKEIYPDILINNAAANFMCPSIKLTPNGYRSIIDTVLYGSLNMTLEGMKMKNVNMVIGNISATYAETGSKGVLPSAMGKAAVNTMTRTLAAEWGRLGVRTFGVAPGAIYTEGAFSRLDPDGKAMEKLVKGNPMGRIGRKDELVDLVLFLSSDRAGFINGEIVRMDGGELNENSGMFNKFL